MLTLLLGKDRVANTKAIFSRIAEDISEGRSGRVLVVPELVSHDMERRLAAEGGNTSSRYAEVLSFSRLARRIADQIGYAAPECLDNGGRVVAMAAAVQQIQSCIKAYASVGTKPEFLVEMVDAIDEFKRCCIAAEDLQRASAETGGSLAQKLEELALLMESYDAICKNGKLDPRDQMTWLLEELEDRDYGREHVLYVDAFPDFTRQHMAILEHFICTSEHVTISFTCDAVDSKALAFEKAGQTAKQLMQIAKKHNVDVDIRYIEDGEDRIGNVCDNLFQGKITDVNNNVSVFRSETVYQECVAVAERILALTQKGVRYKDIGVVCGNVGTYRNMLHYLFERCGIPVYLSGTDSILEKSVIATVLAAIDTAISGFEQKDVLRYLKTALSPLDHETSDLLENYVIQWGITRDQWLEPWTYHPKGLGEKWDSDSQVQLQRLNNARATAVGPLEHLRKAFFANNKLSVQIVALYTFFEEIQLADKLTALAAEFDAGGDNRNAQILNQLWEILIGALEQLHDTLGESIWEPETFTRLFKLLLTQYSVGTIPPVLDAVTAGSASAMRCQMMKHLFVLGMKEGDFPKYGNTAGVLTDQERNQLRAIGLPLTGGALDGLKIEFSEIYEVFCGVSESITVSCPSGQPSFVYQRLRQIAADESSVGDGIGAALVNKEDAAAYLVRFDARSVAQELELRQEYDDVIGKRNHELGAITRENTQKLYGQTLNLSASQIDKQANCRFAYFLKYGLRLNERKTITIDPAEFGTYVHDVLEKTVADVMALGGFSQVPEEKMQQIAMEHSHAYAKLRFQELGTDRINYLFKRNEQELKMIISDLWNELRISEFTPKYFELAFDDDGVMPAISIPGSHFKAKLRGYVDRVDVWNHDGRTYFRVIDYKTGKKSFDYCDVINGIGLQMLLYLFALEESGQSLIGDNGKPAGVQYFPARSPILSLKGELDADKIQKERAKEQVRKGLLLSDETVLQAMEPLNGPNRLPCSKAKDGSLTGDVASLEQFAKLKEYVFKFLRGMVDDIASGCVKPNPYFRDERTNACRFCPYGAVCHRLDQREKRTFKAINSDVFWEDVEKGGSNNG